jgi:hypothetical protein
MVATSPPVSALWIGKTMGPYEHLCLSSFARAGYRVQVFTYEPDLIVPDGTEWCDARDVLPESMVFENHSQPGTFAAFSNLFRYRLLQLQETTWIDTDVMLVADSLPDGPYLFGFEDPGYVNGAILRAPMSSPFLAYLFDTSTAIEPAEIVWGQVGPKLITEAITRFDLDALVQPADVLYPVHYRDVGMLFDPAQLEVVQERLEHASTLHLWNEILRRGGPVKQVRPPRGSWLAHAFDSSEIDFGSRFEHDVDWVCGAVNVRKITAETAIAQRDSAISQRKAAIAERDAAIAERDAAIAERDGRGLRLGWPRRKPAKRS